MPDTIGNGMLIALALFGLCSIVYRWGFESGVEQANLKNRLEQAERIASGFPVKSGIVAKAPATIEGDQA